MASSAPTQAVILCGGLGSRLRPLTDTLPKPMIPVLGRPFLHFLLEQLADQGITRFVLLTGYLANKISDYFGNGEDLGWDIRYSVGPAEWDTGRRIWEARDTLDDMFLLLYSDNFAQFDLAKMAALQSSNKSAISLLLSKKDTGNVSIGKDNRLMAYDRTRQSDNLDYVELGYMVVDKTSVLSYFDRVDDAPDISFSAILEILAADEKISGLIAGPPYYSISDLGRLEILRDHLTPKKILLLDRDGTLHAKAPRGEYVTQWSEIEMLPEAIDGLKILSSLGFKFIIISNQAGIGRGLVQATDVSKLNTQIQDYFSEMGVEILDFYVCPHHWEDNCLCRKPLPGMFYQCAGDYRLRLEQVLYVGDDPRDCGAAASAGCSSIYVGDRNELDDEHVDLPILATSSILSAVDQILDFYHCA